MSNESPENLKDTTPKTSVTQKDIASTEDNIQKSKDIATENTRKEVYEKFGELRADKTIFPSLKDVQKIIDSMESNKITPEAALKQIYKLEVTLRTPFVPPAF